MSKGKGDEDLKEWTKEMEKWYHGKKKGGEGKKKPAKKRGNVREREEWNKGEHK